MAWRFRVTCTHFKTYLKHIWPELHMNESKVLNAKELWLFIHPTFNLLFQWYVLFFVVGKWKMSAFEREIRKQYCRRSHSSADRHPTLLRYDCVDRQNRIQYRRTEQNSKWVWALSALMHKKAFLTGPLSSIILCPSHGSPVPQLTMQTTTTHRLLTHSGPSKRNPNRCVWVKPRLQTHTQHELSFPPMLHTSYISECQSASLYTCPLRVLCPVRRPITTLGVER
jgi:hypothetical protein